MVDFDAVVLGAVFAVFGEDQRPVYRPRGGEPYEIDGIFDRGHVGVVMGEDGIEVSTVAPSMGVREVDIRDRPKASDMCSDMVDIPKVGLRYVISDAQPDGQGHRKLLLNKVGPIP